MNPAVDSADYQGDLIGKSIRQHHFSDVATNLELFIDGVAQPGMPTAYFFRDAQQMNSAELEAIRQCRGRVLDVGAGAGCHALELQKRGLEVVALERSPHACAVMLDRGVDNVVQSEVLQYQTTGFDTILLLMNGFGIGGDEEGVIQLLSHLKKLLAPGGRILGDSTDIRYFKGENDSYEMEHKPFCEVEFEVRVGDSSEFFPWVYPDEVLLEVLAEEAGLQYRTVMYDGDFHFLSELYV
jgi:SAM-dependent methyltransferase